MGLTMLDMTRDTYLGLRVSTELRKRVEARAKDEHRTLSQMVEVLLLQALGARTRPTRTSGKRRSGQGGR
jgi:hypothetical protein